MTYLLIFLAISLTASEKLDRTYLPPPGAQFAGGNPGDIQAPLEPPNLPDTASIPTGYIPNRLNEPREPFIKLPITTTSYAFTQTTTFPSVESYKATSVPINPLIGFQVQNLGQNNNQQHNEELPNYFQQNDAYGINIQPGSLNQNQNQNIDGPKGEVLISSSNFQKPISNSGFQQYPSKQLDEQKFYQNLEPSVIQSHPFTVQDNIVPHDQYSANRSSDISTELVPQDNTRTLSEATPLFPNNQGYQTHEMKGIPQQQFSPEISNISNPRLLSEKDFKQPEQLPNDVFSSTTSNMLSESAYSTGSPTKYYERPQALRDRGAVILNYENVLKPNSYSYSYDTSNGIHADESGIVGDGTKAKGSYAYTGDDGKIYSIVYTADENGFQAHGDHLPTPPPIPEAIKRVIEQAARDKEAGIIDDGSYDENKYGYKNYEKPFYHHQMHGNKLESKTIPPILGITNNEYYEQQPGILLPEDVNVGNENKSYKNYWKYSKNEHNNNESKGYDSGEPNYKKNNSDISITQDNLVVIPAVDDHILPVSGDIQQNTFNFKANDPTNAEVEGINPNQELDFASRELSKPGQASASTNDFFSEISSIRQDNKESQAENRPTTRIVNNNYIEKNIPQNDYDNKNENNFNGREKGSPSYDSQYTNDKLSNQETNTRVNGNGYYSDSPGKLVELTKFSSRLKAEKEPKTTELMYTSFNEPTTPVSITPEVDIEPKNKKQYSNRKSTTLRPFMTSRVTTSREGPYSDYDDDEDSDDNELVISSKQANKDINNSGHHLIQPSQTVTQHYMLTTPSTTQSSSTRFGITETPEKTSNTDQYHRFGAKKPFSSNDFRNYMYQTTRPSLNIEKTITPDYSSSAEHRVGPYNPLETREYSPREYSTSTLKPASSTTLQTNPGYERDSDYFKPSEIQSSFPRDGFQYQPVGFEKNPISSMTKNRYESVSPEYTTTVAPSTQSQDSFVRFGYPKSKVPQTLSTGYLYIPPKIVFPSMVPTYRPGPDSTIPSTQSQVFSTTTLRPTYSSEQDTDDQNAIVDGFGRPIISESQSIILAPDQKPSEYTEPHMSTEDGFRNFDGKLVGSSVLSGDYSPKYKVEQSLSYPGYNNPELIARENLSGPKQPQNYDSQSGYYYK